MVWSNALHAMHGACVMQDTDILLECPAEVDGSILQTGTWELTA